MHNLAALSQHDKNRVELDKQAAYSVWQVKQGKKGQEVFFEVSSKIASDDEREFFNQAVEKYKVKMNV